MPTRVAGPAAQATARTSGTSARERPAWPDSSAHCPSGSSPGRRPSSSAGRPGQREQLAGHHSSIPGPLHLPSVPGCRLGECRYDHLNRSSCRTSPAGAGQATVTERGQGRPTALQASWLRRPGCRGGPRPARGGGGLGYLRPAPGPPGARRGDEGCWRTGSGGQGFGVAADRAQADGQGVGGGRVSGWSSPRSRRRRARVSWSRCTWVLLSSPAIPALSPRRRGRAKHPGCC